MGFVIQPGPGKAEVRPSYWTYPGAADNAARDRLGAKSAIADPPGAPRAGWGRIVGWERTSSTSWSGAA
jgi:hypothetical protein